MAEDWEARAERYRLAWLSARRRAGEGVDELDAWKRLARGGPAPDGPAEGPVLGREDIRQWRDDMRAYRSRQAEWLGLNTAEVVELNDKPLPTKTVDPFGPPPGLEVTWEGAVDQSPRRGHVAPSSMSVDDEDGVRYTGSIWLNYGEAQTMEEVIGKKPTPPWET